MITDTDPPAQPPEARLLELAREREGLSVREAADRAGASISLWRQYEAGYATPAAGVQVPKTAPAATFARMALAVRLTAEVLESRGVRPDAVSLMRDISNLDTHRPAEPGQSLAATIPDAHVSVSIVRPGDKLLIAVNRRITASEANDLRERLEAQLPGVEFGVVEAAALMAYRAG